METKMKLFGWLLFTALCAAVLARGPQGRRPGTESEEEGGNNLSFPVIWSEGSGLALPGTFDSPVFDGNPVVDPTDGTEWWEQQNPLNAWQAESLAVTSTDGSVEIDTIDWGDNLEAKSWNTYSPIRVEAVPYKTLGLTTDPEFIPGTMLGFTMRNLTPDIKGPEEMWGTNQVTYNGGEATIYSPDARLTIQRLEDDYDPAALEWNSSTGKWDGPVTDTEYNGAYSAEINIQGKVVYGYNWSVGAGPGIYRITFSLPDAGNAFFSDNTTVKASEEVAGYSILSVSDKAGSTPSGGVAEIEPDDNLSYIDVQILNRSGGGSRRGR